jgi:hypothetical protein
VASRRARLACTAGLALALGASPSGAQLALVSDDRAVSVDVTATEDYFASCAPLITPGCAPDSTTTASYPDSASAGAGAPFSATASRPEFPGTWASQDSQVGAAGVSASGSHAATATFSNTGGFPITYHSETHAVESRLAVDFELAAATPYVLSGSVATGGAIFSVSSSRIRLSGPGGTIAEVRVDSDPDCVDPGCFQVGAVPLSSSGTLAPGPYALEAVAGGTASGVHSTLGSFGTGIDGSFEVELALAPAVPSLGPPGVALLAMALAVAVAIRSARRRCGSTPGPLSAGAGEPARRGPRSRRRGGRSRRAPGAPRSQRRALDRPPPAPA